ncbi:hypothetical protein BH10ACT3_BH10ACT3_16330 [soil metagenome]
MSDPGPQPVVGGALPSHRRPTDDTPVHTADLPPLPLRDRNTPATAWIEDPQKPLDTGLDIEADDAMYKRRINRWLLWRAGPATKANARYVAIDADDLSRLFSFRLFPDGSGEGTGPLGVPHDRFRTWKEELRDHE